MHDGNEILLDVDQFAHEVDASASSLVCLTVLSLWRFSTLSKNACSAYLKSRPRTSTANNNALGTPAAGRTHPTEQGKHAPLAGVAGSVVCAQ